MAVWEILLSFGIKAAVILLLGAPAVAVLLFEVLLPFLANSGGCAINRRGAGEGRSEKPEDA